MRPSDIFSKKRPIFKIYGANDQADGKGVDVREDAEQLEKFQNIIDLFISAGYFRAQVQGLSPFDKIVGGMTWCIEVCDFDIDVDLFYQENLTIGKKIALTEKIVAVLPKMGCPHVIEPHQIQGLDFINIFKVIQWLVKRSVESRVKKADLLKQFSVEQFDKQCILDYDKRIKESNEQLLKNLVNVRNKYRPVRERRRMGALPATKIEQATSTLLEYSQRLVINDNTYYEEDGELEDDPVEVIDIDSLASNLLCVQKDNGSENADVKLSEKEVLERKLHYAILHSELTGEDSEEVKENYARSVMLEMESLNSKLKQLQTTKKSLENQISKAVLELDKMDEVKRKQEIELNKILNPAGYASFDRDLALKKLEANMKVLEKKKDLEKKEALFRKQCKTEYTLLQQKLNDLKNKTEDERTREMEEAVPADLLVRDEEIKALLSSERAKLAKINRAVATVIAKIDDVPGRAELSQYQRRFLELYKQVSDKHKETKQFFTFYNTLHDIKMYISKELNLLNSILDTYQEAMLSHSNRDQFISQMVSIVESVKQSKLKVEKKYLEEKDHKDKLSKELTSLIELQRLYNIAVKKLTEECKKNELLQAQLYNLQ